ncbi:39S ribosomal protein L41, mitochondrial [Halotydeus destructor]|nr:39S ribosomal protein L41, mitochondrial [Halotydeus destructor]
MFLRPITSVQHNWIYSCAKNARNVHLSAVHLGGKEEEDFRNFRKFTLPQRLGQYDIKHTPLPLLETLYDYPLSIDTLKQKYPGYWFVQRIGKRSKRKFVYVKEMEPELLVPDLTDFKLKPYVSYRAPEITQAELTARALFIRVYGPKISAQFRAGEEVKSIVSDEEIELARVRARQTGSDLFVSRGYDVNIPRVQTEEEEKEEERKLLETRRKYGVLPKENLEENYQDGLDDLTVDIWPTWRENI